MGYELRTRINQPDELAELKKKVAALEVELAEIKAANFNYISPNDSHLYKVVEVRRSKTESYQKATLLGRIGNNYVARPIGHEGLALDLYPCARVAVNSTDPR
jgi:hypothetical protein